MRLNSFDALNAFAQQLERNISGGSFKTKVIVTPSSVNEKGVVIKVSLLKTYIPAQPPAAMRSRELRLRVSVAGTAESMTGLKQAVEAVEALDRYLITPGLRLEIMNGSRVPVGISNSRIIQAVSAEDSFIDSPDSTAVQDVQDDRIVIITIPQGGD
ncbi:MAG: hypothetical protein LBH16_09270 [Treponema sp.]|nr:hypothetical protein [Treponema sp.]